MSQTKTRRKASWVGWLLSIILIAGSLWLWLERQYVVDLVQYSQYHPTSVVETIAARAKLTDNAKFTFYATRPAVESSDAFNRHCERKEANSPILGCYVANRIYIFDVTDSRLEGIKTVTAAHELLHAEYDRMSSGEKERLKPLLQAAYDKLATDNLKERMKYYEKTEPGEAFNELHSILGTEFSPLGPELEVHYNQYFSNRQAVVDLHEKVEGAFTSLSKEAKQLADQISALARKINQATKQYNGEVEILNQDVEVFNARAAQPGGFTTQSEFQAARQALMSRSAELNALRQQIQTDTVTYKTLLARLDSINAQTSELNQSLDSSLSDAPEI